MTQSAIHIDGFKFFAWMPLCDTIYSPKQIENEFLNQCNSSHNFYEEDISCLYDYFFGTLNLNENNILNVY